MSRRPAGQSEPNLQRQDFRTVAEHWIGKLKEFSPERNTLKIRMKLRLTERELSAPV